jgi:glucose/arabinose dehydrogenase
VGALAGQHLRRVVLDGHRAVHQESLLTALGRRIRDVRVGPDGNLYVLTDEANGQLLRIEPRN